MTDKRRDPVKKEPLPAIVARPLLEDRRRMIEETRQGVAVAVNAALTMLYWRIGKRINEEILKGERAEYGKEIVGSLARQLEVDYGRGFSEKSLRHMLRFAEAFPNEQIVSALMRQLSWTHFLSIIYLQDSLQRDFYAEMCRIERWSTRTLQKKIGSMLFERREGEETPLGMILCAGKKQEQIELLELGRSGIHVAEYLTDSLPKEVLQTKLRKAIALARRRLENRDEEGNAEDMGWLREGE